MCDLRVTVAVCLTMLTGMSASIAQESVRLLPRALTLNGVEGTHRVLAERFRGEEAVGPSDSTVTRV